MGFKLTRETFFRLLRHYLKLFVADGIVVAASLWLAWSLRTVTADLPIEPVYLFTALSVLIFWLSNTLFRLYGRIWKYASIAEVEGIAASVLLGTFLILFLDMIWPQERPLPISVVLSTGFFAFSGFVAIRYRERLWSGLKWRWHKLMGRRTPQRERVLIVGAGEAGEVLARRFLTGTAMRRYQLIGFVDDDPAKHKMRLHNLPIFGGHTQLPEIVQDNKIDLIVIGIYNITGEKFRAMLDQCESTNARVKIVPDLLEFLQTRGDALPVRDISSEDLLGRKAVEIDESACRKLLEGRRVLVTGAAGSIGSELSQQILSYGPEILILLDNNESELYNLHNKLDRFIKDKYKAEGKTIPDNVTANLTPVVCSVTNRSKMNYVFSKYGPEIVFHAAAYKHVPLMEDQPDEALWVNVYGTKNLVELSREYGIERFVFVSTDKAVQPVCVMGATKYLGELMTIHPDAWSRRERSPESVERRKRQRRAGLNGEQEHHQAPNTFMRSTLYTAVRFGNVLSSRGSVVPLFEQQIKAGGPVKVTHPDMTRYFMSISEAVRLIIQAATFTEGRDIFMLHMGERIKIDDLARRLIRLRGGRPDIDIPIVYTGIRPGEKLNEELIGPNEIQRGTLHPRIFRLQKKQVPEPESIASVIDELQSLARDHRNNELVERLQQFISDQEGEKGAGALIPYRDRVSELIQNGRSAEEQQQWDEALRQYEEALKLSDGVQNRCADLLCWMGNVHRRKGEITKASELLTRSREISRRNGYISGLLLSNAHLGALAEEAGNHAKALKQYNAALRLSVLYNNEEGIGGLLVKIAAIHERDGKYRKALKVYRRALKFWKDPASPQTSATLLRIGACLLRLGSVQRAEAYLNRALIFARQQKESKLQVRIFIRLAKLNLIKEEREKAREQAEQALDLLLADTPAQRDLVEVYLILGNVFRLDGKYGIAEQHLQKALTLSRECESFLLAGDVYAEYAQWYLSQDQGESALMFLSRASQQHSQVTDHQELQELKSREFSLEKQFFRAACEIGRSFDSRTQYSREHSQRVAFLCLVLAEKLNLTSDQKKALVAAAFIHDMGESQVGKSILEKTGPLTAEERQQVEEHVLHAASVIQRIQFPWPEVLAYVKYHHERYDGRGYPLGLKGDEIHLGARILSLVDFYDAVTADRPYRKAYPIHQALTMIRQESGKRFDPRIVESFLDPAFMDVLLAIKTHRDNRYDPDEIWDRVSPIKEPVHKPNIISPGLRIYTQSNLPENKSRFGF